MSKKKGTKESSSVNSRTNGKRLFSIPENDYFRFLSNCHEHGLIPDQILTKWIQYCNKCAAEGRGVLPSSDYETDTKVLPLDSFAKTALREK